MTFWRQFLSKTETHALAHFLQLGPNILIRFKILLKQIYDVQSLRAVDFESNLWWILKARSLETSIFNLETGRKGTNFEDEIEPL